jgi:hypothetical protein
MASHRSLLVFDTDHQPKQFLQCTQKFLLASLGDEGTVLDGSMLQALFERFSSDPESSPASHPSPASPGHLVDVNGVTTIIYAAYFSTERIEGQFNRDRFAKTVDVAARLRSSCGPTTATTHLVPKGTTPSP